MRFVPLVEELEKGDAAEVDACDVGGESMLEGFEGGFPEVRLERRDVI